MSFSSLLSSNRSSLPSSISLPEHLAYGFLQVANEAMCRPIRNLTQMRGFDITSHVLSCFGGAGPQHACAVAKKLGMGTVHVHKYGGVLSAYGLSLSDAVAEVSEPAFERYSRDEDAADANVELRAGRFAELASKAKRQLVSQGYATADIKVERFLNLRYEGTDTAVMTPELSAVSPPDSPPDSFFTSYVTSFKTHYKREFGFDLDRDIFVDDYRVRCVIEGPTPPTLLPCPTRGPPPASSAVGTSRTYFETGWQTVNVYDMDLLLPGHAIAGPAIIVQSISTVVVECDCLASITSEGCISIAVSSIAETKKDKEEDKEDDKEEDEGAGEGEDAEAIVMNPIQLSIFGHRFMGIAESMGKTLQRTSVSVNIKERLDFR